MINIKKISIISTEQNYKWFSMQEILPCISKCWEGACSDLSIESKIFNIDTTPIREISKFLLQSDLIVIIAFNENIAKFIKHIRNDFSIDAPFIVHLHGLGTIGLWPLSKLKVLDVMTEGDTFIGTCPGDQACMRLTSPNAKTHIIPYPYYSFKETFKNTHAQKVFAYIGRLSDQKNINLLVDSYYILLSQNNNIPQFFIYGKEDFLGSPNIGIKSSSCLENLRTQIEKYKLEDRVILKGFLPREEIYNEIGSQHIFLSASTHSDENFGMALMRSLACGGSAVVSDWGGHKVFKRGAIDNKVKLCPVSFENFRPVVNPQIFAELMKQSLLENQLIEYNNLPRYFTSESVINQFKDLIIGYETSQSALKLSDLAKTLYEHQKTFESQGFKQKAFSSYDDPIAQLFLKAYAE